MDSQVPGLENPKNGEGYSGDRVSRVPGKDARGRCLARESLLDFHPLWISFEDTGEI